MKRLLLAAGLVLLAMHGAQALTKDQKREQMIAATLPPEDRPGIFLIFPTEAGGFQSNFQIVYFPEEVGEKQVQARIARICAAHRNAQVDGRLHVWRPSKPDAVKLADGRQRPAMKTTLSCFAR
ncbi:hypothetical protein [Paracoccus aminovorans]|uniref:hypothetical protein n=1 Tax=Paracoccus aminovorans TaxID=34004 RepID=UPI002B2607F5|nr:hypothetical protein [Paracoccus aminovorans]